jgi:hypothetical protein
MKEFYQKKVWYAIEQKGHGPLLKVGDVELLMSTLAD